MKSKLLQAAAATLALRESNIQSSVAVSYKNLSGDVSPKEANRIPKLKAIGAEPPKSSALNVILSVSEEDEEDSSGRPKVSEQSSS